MSLPAERCSAADYDVLRDHATDLGAIYVGHARRATEDGEHKRWVRQLQDLHDYVRSVPPFDGPAVLAARRVLADALRRYRPAMTQRIEDHHPATLQVYRFFDYDHLPEGPLRNASARFHSTATAVLYDTPPGPEVTVGLRKLLEAKDCIVRACLPPKEQAVTDR